MTVFILMRITQLLYMYSRRTKVFDASYVMSQFNNIRKYKSSEVTSYTYSPTLLLKSITQPNGYTLYYMYDDFRRLKEIRNNSGNILQSFNYNVTNP